MCDSFRPFHKRTYIFFSIVWCSLWKLYKMNQCFIGDWFMQSNSWNDSIKIQLFLYINQFKMHALIMIWFQLYLLHVCLMWENMKCGDTSLHQSREIDDWRVRRQSREGRRVMANKRNTKINWGSNKEILLLCQLAMAIRFYCLSNKHAILDGGGVE